MASVTNGQTATCGGCDKAITFQTITTNRGSYTQWAVQESKHGCLVSDSHHYLADADGIATGTQGHYPVGSEPTQVRDLRGDPVVT